MKKELRIESVTPRATKSDQIVADVEAVLLERANQNESGFVIKGVAFEVENCLGEVFKGGGDKITGVLKLKDVKLDSSKLIQAIRVRVIDKTNEICTPAQVNIAKVLREIKERKVAVANAKAKAEAEAESKAKAKAEDYAKEGKVKEVFEILAMYPGHPNLKQLVSSLANKNPEGVIAAFSIYEKAAWVVDFKIAAEEVIEQRTKSEQQKPIEEAEKQRKIKAKLKEAKDCLHLDTGKDTSDSKFIEGLTILLGHAAHPLARDIVLEAAERRPLCMIFYVRHYCDIAIWSKEVFRIAALKEPKYALDALSDYCHQSWAFEIVAGIAMEQSILAFEKIEMYEHQFWAKQVAEEALTRAPEAAIKYFDKYKYQPWAVEIRDKAQAIIDQRMAAAEAQKQETLCTAAVEKARLEQEAVDKRNQDGVCEARRIVESKDASNFKKVFRILAGQMDNPYSADIAKQAAEISPQTVVRYVDIYKITPWAEAVLLAICEKVPAEVVSKLLGYQHLRWAQNVTAKAEHIIKRRKLRDDLREAEAIIVERKLEQFPQAFAILSSGQGNPVAEELYAVQYRNQKSAKLRVAISERLEGMELPKEAVPIYGRETFTEDKFRDKKCAGSLLDLLLFKALATAPTETAKCMDVYKTAPWAKAVFELAWEIDEGTRNRVEATRQNSNKLLWGVLLAAGVAGAGVGGYYSLNSRDEDRKEETQESAASDSDGKSMPIVAIEKDSGDGGEYNCRFNYYSSSNKVKAECDGVSGTDLLIVFDSDASKGRDVMVGKLLMDTDGDGTKGDISCNVALLRPADKTQSQQLNVVGEDGHIIKDGKLACVPMLQSPAL